MSFYFGRSEVGWDLGETSRQKGGNEEEKNREGEEWGNKGMVRRKRGREGG